jgi:hypothetical protein
MRTLSHLIVVRQADLHVALADQLGNPSMSSNRAYTGRALARTMMRNCASWMTVFLLTAVQIQKPAARFCGRVLGEAIHFEQNTMFDRTSQMKIEVFFHRCGKDRPPIGGVFARAVGIN